MFKARNAGTVFAVVVVALMLLAACSCGGDDDDDTGSSSCEYRSSAMTATASDGSSVEVREDTCVEPKPDASVKVKSLSEQTGLTNEQRRQLEAQGTIYSILDITPDGRSWNPAITVVFVLQRPAPENNFELTIRQWRASSGRWAVAGKAVAKKKGDREARGTIDHTSLFALVDESVQAAEVPYVIGLYYDEAVEAIIDAGFAVGTVFEESIPDAEPGTVVDQGLAPGDTAASGTEIDLMVASPEETVTVPDVIDLDLDLAMEIIVTAGLDVGSVAEGPYSDTPNSVVEQSHAPGEQVSPGTPIHLVVTIQEEGVQTPNLLGLYVEEAAQLLAERGLQLGQIVEVEDYERESGTVVWQSVEPGALVSPDTVVHLEVATSPQAEPPTAEFYAEAGEGAQQIDDSLIRGGCSFTVVFLNFSSNAEEFFWDFGDAGSSSQRDPTHTYKVSEGTYQFSVTLYASGPGGQDQQTKVDLIQAICIQ
jgi:beta-lactam-binding protein with PASTA domain